ncbi:hypothetical protein VTI74DRAFT_869 [Chaetomium olivicolor]
MDLTSDIFNSILSPLAAFLPLDKPTPESASPDPTQDTHDDLNPHHDNSFTTWQTSSLNPQSRLDSLAPLPPPLPPQAGEQSKTTWRLDRIDPTGRRFFATPSFALNNPPLRIDVYMPPMEEFPRTLREVVKPQEAVYRRKSLGDLDVGRIQSGDRESGGHGHGRQGGLEKLWWSMPFGSVISVDPSMGSGKEEVCLVPDYGIEQDMMPIDTLKRMWQGEVAEETWEDVEMVNWERIRFKRQVHEVISLVTVDGFAEGQEVVFKCVLQDQRYMYNELKMLLSMRPHPNVVSRPLGVVAKRGRFGNRRGVCGFLLEWFPLGSLRETLIKDDYHGTTSMEQRFRWARQVTEALLHVNRQGRAGFYPDLKPDNILLRQDMETGMLDIVLIDLEQRGGWFAWSPPEVAYVEYLEILVDDSGLPEGDLKDEIIAQLRSYYNDPEWSPTGGTRRGYHNAEGGFSTPWLALLKERQTEGKWKGLLERAQDADPEYEAARSGKAMAFPESSRTPPLLRQLIRHCTAGAAEWTMEASKGIDEATFVAQG